MEELALADSQESALFVRVAELGKDSRRACWRCSSITLSSGFVLGVPYLLSPAPEDRGIGSLAPVRCAGGRVGG